MMRILFLRDYPGTGDKAGTVRDVGDSFGYCMCAAHYAREAAGMEVGEPVQLIAEPVISSADLDRDDMDDE